MHQATSLIQSHKSGHLSYTIFFVPFFYGPIPSKGIMSNPEHTCTQPLSFERKESVEVLILKKYRPDNCCFLCFLDVSLLFSESLLMTLNRTFFVVGLCKKSKQSKIVLVDSREAIQMSIRISFDVDRLKTVNIACHNIF